MTTTSWAVVLPSRDEPNTIAAVAMAADRTLGDPDALIVNVDHSRDNSTKQAFDSASTRARRQYLPVPSLGKGVQLLHGLGYVRQLGFGRALVLDTDVTNPSSLLYGSLVAAVEQGCDFAVPAYRRHWFEANLTNHVVRPLLAATTGVDIDQPLAGDVALSVEAVAALEHRYGAQTDAMLRACIGGYGIDAFVTLAVAAMRGRIRSVVWKGTKHHASSFGHLPKIYREAVPVLLAVTAWSDPIGAVPHTYDLAPTALPEPSLIAMLQELRDLRSACLQLATGHPSWPKALSTAWLRTRRGDAPILVAERLWPFYLDRVMDYLAIGHSQGVAAATDTLAAAGVMLGHDMKQAAELGIVESA
ncbi:MAG: hypothetical protein ACRDQ5_20675 [Sciscionella sp.]